MKIKSTLISLTVLCCLVVTNPYHSQAAVSAKTPADPIDEKKPALKAKAYSSRNNHAVKIYPDAIKRVMHVVARDNDDKEIEFFVFDMDSTLVQHFKMKEGDHQKLAGLQRGKYVYHVFAGDEETAMGNFEIR
jgi:hypothetical protein